MTRISLIGLKIFALGILGVASLLTINIPVPTQISEHFSPLQIKLLTLINPTILLLLAVTAGVFANRLLNLRLSNFQGFFQYDKVTLIDIAKTSVLGGVVLAVILITLTHFLAIFVNINQDKNIEVNLAVRLLYGGITEEILMRFGVMTSVAALIYKFINKNHHTSIVYALIISSAIFALGHMPIAFVVYPNPSLGLICYIFFANMIGGVFFGFLYWQRGLDYAMIAHMTTHLTTIIFP